MLILVTGGAGFLGINLCRALLARGYAVRSLDIAPFEYPERMLIDAVRGDIRHADAVERCMTDVRAVVHCAAALPLATRDEILSTGIDGTRILLEAAARHRVERFVFISSTAVYGIPRHVPLLENEPLSGVGPYGESKIAAEAYCRAYRDRLVVPVLRPKTFVGPERLGAFELLYEWAFSGRSFPVLGRGENRYQLLDVEDLCRAIACCLTADPVRASDTFNLGAQVFGTMRDNIQVVLDRAGHGRHVVALPAAPAVALLRLFEQLRLSPLYAWIYETAGKESWVSTDRIAQRLGFRPRYSNAEALVRNYDWYVVHRDEYRGRAGTTHRVPWKRGILDLARLFF